MTIILMQQKAKTGSQKRMKTNNSQNQRSDLKDKTGSVSFTSTEN